jgi:hypothetical protein
MQAATAHAYICLLRLLTNRLSATTRKKENFIGACVQIIEDDPLQGGATFNYYFMMAT